MNRVHLKKRKMRRGLGAIIILFYIMLVNITIYVICFFLEKEKAEGIVVNEIIADYGTLLTVIVTFAGVIGIVASQIIFYRKDSKVMSDIQNDVSLGNRTLQDKLEHKQELLSGEHKDLSREHKDLSKEHKDLSGEHKEIREIVKEIHTRQEFELKTQEKIRDIVPDAGMLKDGIDKICRENAALREQVTELKQEMKQLKEQNQKLSRNLQRANENSFDMEV